jgi:hypothetical protein
LALRIARSETTLKTLRVRLHVAAQALHVILQLTAGAAERVADSHVNVFVLGLEFDVFLQPKFFIVAQDGVSGWFMADHEFGSRQAQFDAYMEEFAPLVVPVWGFHEYATTRDAVKERIQLGGLRLDARRDGVGRFHVSVGDLDRQFHTLDLWHVRRAAALRELAKDKLHLHLETTGNRSVPWRARAALLPSRFNCVVRAGWGSVCQGRATTCQMVGSGKVTPPGN